MLLNFVAYSNLTYRKVHILFFFAVITLSFYLFSLVVALRTYRSGSKSALLYFVAFLFFFSANIVYAVRTAISMHGWMGEHILQIGNTIEVVILSVGLAHWFKIHYDERQRLLVLLGKKQTEIENEKDRIARDLHDNIGTQLTSLSLGLNRLSESTMAEPSKLKALYDHTNATISELRNTIWVINKSEVTLQELADKVSLTFWRLQQHDTLITYQLHTANMNGSLALQPSQALNLFRIAQEAINNSLKHSKATTLMMVLETKEKKVNMTLSDNGIGFDKTTALLTDHYGIVNMRKRAAEIKGSLLINSALGEGTKIEVQMPMGSEEVRGGW